MSRENVEVVRRLYEAFLAGGSEEFREGQVPEAFLAGLDPEVVWDMTESGLPDMGEGRYEGIEGTRRFWQSFLAAWKTVKFDYELVDAGDRVLGLIEQKLGGRSTGLEFDLSYVQLVSFRDGRVLGVRIYADREEAFRAAGLDPPADA